MMNTRLSIGLILTLSVCLIRLPAAFAADDWKEPDYPARVFFSIPEQADGPVVVLVSSNTPVQQPSSCRAFFNQGEPAAAKLISAGTNGAAFLIAVSNDVPESRKRCVLYFGKPGRDEPAPGLKDATPVSVEARRTQVRSIPTSWPKLLYFFQHASRGDRVANCQDFGTIEMPEVMTTSDRGERKRQEIRWVARLRSYFMCPIEGSYRFALDCRDAGYLLVDGDVVAGAPGEHETGEWHIGEPVQLAKGVHVMEVYNTCGDRLVARVGYCSATNTKGIVRFPSSQLLASESAKDARVEIKGRAVNPDFSFEITQAHALKDTGQSFIPVRFRNNTVESSAAGKIEYRWLFGDGTEAAVRQTNHLYSAPSRFTVRLEARYTNDAVAACEKEVDCRLVQPREWPVAFDVIDLPAVCYPHDKIMPRLRYQGKLPAGKNMEFTWEVVMKNGRTTNSTAVLTPAVEMQFLLLAEGEAGSYDSIKWSVRLDGRDTDSGDVKFLSPPFAELPFSADTDRLCSQKGTQLVLLPNRYGWRTCQPLFSPGNKKLVCLDDSLLPAGVSALPEAMRYNSMLAVQLGGIGATVVYARPPDRRDSPLALGELQKFVAVRQYAGDSNAVFILSIAVADILENHDPDGFERSAAALTDLISCTMGIPVVWVTPPPLVAEQDLVRKYAAVIKRICDGRRIPVADIYTIMRTSSEGTRPFVAPNGTLTAKGHKVAADAIAAALLNGDSDDE